MNSLIHRNCAFPAYPAAFATSQVRRSGVSVPKAQVVETQEAVVVDLELPGLTREAIEITVENDELTVVGRRPVPTVSEDAPAPTVLLSERPAGDFRRTFVLGERLDGQGITASLANGVLSIRVPKGEKAKPRTIEVQ